MTRVSCWSNSGCFAVGWYSSFKGDITFTERWNGNKWSIVKSASPPEVANTSNSNKLVDVSCAAANFCFAVAYYLTSDELAVDQNPYGLRWVEMGAPAHCAARAPARRCRAECLVRRGSTERAGRRTGRRAALRRRLPVGAH